MPRLHRRSQNASLNAAAAASRSQSPLAKCLVAALMMAACTTLAGCESRPTQQRNAAETATRREVNMALQRYADAARAVDANASAAFFATNGVLFEPGIPPIQSPDSIRAFISSFPGVQVDTATLTADTIDVYNYNTAYVWGSYYERLRFAGQPPSAQRGRFVMKWVQQPNRNWLIEKYYRMPLPDAPAQGSPAPLSQTPGKP